MSDERHDEIAARLRAEAGARAPERLRADVMLQVRAEPRPRRIRPHRRRTWRPLGAVAAVASVLAALVVGINHGAGSSPNLGAGASTGAERAGAVLTPHGASGQRLAHAQSSAATKLQAPVVPARTPMTANSPVLSAAQAVTLRRYAHLPRPLWEALRSLALHGRRGAH